MLNLRVPAGIGDISWCYSKLAHIGEKFNFYISADNPRRSLEFVKLLPNVVSVQYDGSNFHNIVEHALPPNTPKEYLLNIASKSIQNFSVNRYLERGNRIEGFMPELQLNLHYQINTSQKDKFTAQELIGQAKIPVGIYTSNYINISAWNGWHLDTWYFLIKELYKHIPGITFIILGAGYDKPFADDLSKLITPVPHINLAGSTTIAQAIEVIKLLKYFISYPCGLPVLANVLNVPVCMFYPKHLERLVNTWADKESIKNLSYKGCTFPDIGEILNWLFSEYHIDKKLIGGDL